MSDVRFGAGEAPLLVVKSAGLCGARVGRCEKRRVLVPFAEEFVKKFDLPASGIDMELPEGMLELDAPLSDEEKQRQKPEADEARAAGEARKRQVDVSVVLSCTSRQ